MDESQRHNVEGQKAGVPADSCGVRDRVSSTVMKSR